jgi:hypothetical protein
MPKRSPLYQRQGCMVPIVLGLGLPVALLLLVGCDGYVGSKVWQDQEYNGAIVRAEMRARGEEPWSSWPWAPRRKAIFE